MVARRAAAAPRRARHHLLDLGMVVDADLGIAGQRRLDAQQVLLAAEMR